jgi:hypothetical protein
VYRRTLTTIRSRAFKHSYGTAILYIQAHSNEKISSSRKELVLGSLGSDTTASDSGGIASELGVSHSSDVLALTSNLELVHMLESVLDGRTVHELGVPGSEVREFTGDVEVRGEEVADGVVVILDERQISDGALVADEPEIYVRIEIEIVDPIYAPSFLAQDVVEDTKDALDFTLESNKDQM